MSKAKALIQSLLSAIVALFCIVMLVLMVCVMIAWTIGLVYVATESGCSVEDGRLICEMASK